VIHVLAAETQSSGGSLIGLMLPLIMIVGLYFIMIRPQRNRQRQQQAMLGALEVGDDVVISGGIYGTVLDIDEEDSTVSVEIAPGTTVRMLRQGIIQRLVEDSADEDYGDEPDPSDDEEAGLQP
jgi:preprotein translocase subunit YajC